MYSSSPNVWRIMSTLANTYMGVLDWNEKCQVAKVDLDFCWYYRQDFFSLISEI